MPQDSIRAGFVGGESMEDLCWSFKPSEIFRPISYSFLSSAKLRQAVRIKNVAGTFAEFNVAGTPSGYAVKHSRLPGCRWFCEVFRVLRWSFV